jgi:hypothetical protein
MAVHVEEVTNDVTVADGDLPLSQPQIEKLVKLVLQRLEAQQRDQKRNREATSMRSTVIPPPPDAHR